MNHNEKFSYADIFASKLHAEIITVLINDEFNHITAIVEKCNTTNRQAKAVLEALIQQNFVVKHIVGRQAIYRYNNEFEPAKALKRTLEYLTTMIVRNT